MKINFCIQGMGVMIRDLTVPIDWNFPHIPRTGDIIGTGIVINGIDPSRFCQCLNEREQEEWSERVRAEMAESGYPEDEAKKIATEVWLDEMSLRVSKVFWDVYGGECRLFIVLKPDR